MGMLIYDALVLARSAQNVFDKQKCLMLGVPTLNFRDEDFYHQWDTHPDLTDIDINRKPFSTAYEFFRNLGFEVVSALDISDYEGADLIADLNSPELPAQLAQQYDFIYDSGTLEHIFDAPTAMRSIAQLLRRGGIVVHATPSNGFLDHGFWQISPDLYRTFYRKAGFEVLSSSLFIFADRPYALRADVNLYRTHGRKYISEMAPEAVLVFSAQKTADGDLGPISLQEYYSQMHENSLQQARSEFFLEFGQPPNNDISRPMSDTKGLAGTLISKLRAVMR